MGGGGGGLSRFAVNAGLIEHSCSPSSAWLVLVFTFISWEEGEAAPWIVLGVDDWETWKS